MAQGQFWYVCPNVKGIKKTDPSLFTFIPVYVTNLDIFPAIDAHVLHDRPPSFFGPTPISRRHELFLRLKDQMDDWKVIKKYERATGIRLRDDGTETLFTVAASSSSKKEKGAGDQTIQSRTEQRPALLVSSTSWTEDEDFGVLLQALELLDTRWSSSSTLSSPSPTTRSKSGSSGKQQLGSHPFLLVIVTGKGPMKQLYEERIRTLDLQHIAIATMWLEAPDYPLLIGAADVGVCLHSSTSGIDLPMKVLDMYGCHVPVCALGFACLPELVRHEVRLSVCTKVLSLFNSPFHVNYIITCNTGEWRCLP